MPLVLKLDGELYVLSLIGGSDLRCPRRCSGQGGIVDSAAWLGSAVQSSGQCLIGEDDGYACESFLCYGTSG